jgi:hypothetical protein
VAGVAAGAESGCAMAVPEPSANSAVVRITFEVFIPGPFAIWERRSTCDPANKAIHARLKCRIVGERKVRSRCIEALPESSSPEDLFPPNAEEAKTEAEEQPKERLEKKRQRRPTARLRKTRPWMKRRSTRSLIRLSFECPPGWKADIADFPCLGHG